MSIIMDTDTNQMRTILYLAYKNTDMNINQTIKNIKSIKTKLNIL